jgi:tetratricopeptide (TPR) repeat protein
LADAYPGTVEAAAALFDLGDLLTSRKFYSEAERVLRRAMEQGSWLWSPLAACHLGITYIIRGMPERARRILRKIMVRWPDRATAATAAGLLAALARRQGRRRSSALWADRQLAILRRIIARPRPGTDEDEEAVMLLLAVDPSERTTMPEGGRYVRMYRRRVRGRPGGAVRLRQLSRMLEWYRGHPRTASRHAKSGPLAWLGLPAPATRRAPGA